MAYGLLQAATDTRKDAMQGMADEDRQRAEREATNKQLEAQHKQQQMTTMGSMAASGAMIGTMAFPGVGTVIGGVIGLVAGGLLSR